MIKEFVVSFDICIGTILTNRIAPRQIVSESNERSDCCEELEVLINQDCKEEENRSTPTFTYFNGTATDVYLNNTVTSYFFYTGQHIYFRFHSQSREYISLNYSGPTANLTIYYSNFFLSSDYLTSITNVGNAIDCYYFDKDAEYILDFSPSVYVAYTPFSFRLEILDLSMSQNEKYVLHQTIDTASNVGFHYKTEFYDVNASSSSSTYAYINNYAPSGGTYLDLIDSQTYFYNPADYTFADNRRLVYDTGYDEYSSIAYTLKNPLFNGKTNGCLPNNFYRGTSTFVSETTVISCAHLFYAEYWQEIDEQNVLLMTGLNKEVSFEPGINTYTNENYYGKFNVTDVFVPVRYILAWNYYGGSTSFSAANDWSICLTANSIAGTRNHSYMGFAQFSYPDSLEYWTHARSAGYPSLKHCASGMSSAYNKTVWASYPLENDVQLNGNVVESYDIITSGANSGGPMYYKTSTIYQGQLVVNSNLLGIMSGGVDYRNNNNLVYMHKTNFCRMTHLIVNMIKTIASIS